MRGSAMKARPEFTLFDYRDAVEDCVTDKSLSAAPRRVLVVMAFKFMNAKRMEAFPSIAMLSVWTAMRRQTVVDALHTLVDEGWLKVKRKGGPNRSTRYSPAIPERYASETVDRSGNSGGTVSRTDMKGLPDGSDSLQDEADRTERETRTSEHAQHVNTRAASAAAREGSRAAPPLSREDLNVGIVGEIVAEPKRDPDDDHVGVLLLRVDGQERTLRLREPGPLLDALIDAYQTAMNQPVLSLHVGDRLDIKAVGTNLRRDLHAGAQTPRHLTARIHRGMD